MSMSKKDYEAVAEVLTTCTDDRDDVILQLASRFAESNSNFRWDLFLEAADYTGDYKVDRFGVIRSPGQFEGENVYMPMAAECEEPPDENDIYTAYIRWAGDETRKVRFVIDHEGYYWELHSEDPDNDDA